MEDNGAGHNTGTGLQFQDEFHNDDQTTDQGEDGDGEDDREGEGDGDGDQEGDGEGYDTVVETESSGEKEKEKRGNGEDILYDINDPMEQDLMDQQLKFEASCKNNLLKVSVPNNNTKSGSNYSTAHSSPAEQGVNTTPTDGAVGGAPLQETGGTTVLTSTSTANPSVPNTNVGTKQKVVGPSTAEVIIKLQYQLEDATINLLQQVLRKEIVDRDQTIHHLDALREEYHLLKNRMQHIQFNDKNYKFAEINIRKLKTLQMSVRALLCPAPPLLLLLQLFQDTEKATGTTKYAKYAFNTSIEETTSMTSLKNFYMTRNSLCLKRMTLQ